MKFQPDRELHFLKNGRLAGSLNMVSTVNSGLADKSLLIDGRVFFNNLSLFMKDIVIEKIDGYFPFKHIHTASKLDRKMLASKSAKNDLQLLNYSLNRAYIKKPDNFTIKKIKIGDIDIENFAFDMEYKDNLLSLRKGYMELLDGSISINNSFFDLGNLSPDTFRYKFNLEVSGVDVRNLPMVKGVKKDEDTTIFANVRINGKGVDLQKSGDIYGAFNITHIGSEVAGRLLSTLDPKGEDGGISLVRNALNKGAQPELLLVELKYGQIFPKLWIKESVLYKYILFMIPRLPPSPIEFKDKSLDVILQSFKKSDKG